MELFVGSCVCTIDKAHWQQTRRRPILQNLTACSVQTTKGAQTANIIIILKLWIVLNIWFCLFVYLIILQIQPCLPCFFFRLCIWSSINNL